MTQALYVAKFTIEEMAQDFGPFKGVTYGVSQKGWGLPYFTKAEADKVMEAWAKDDCLDAWYDVDRDCYFFATPDTLGRDEYLDDDLDDCEQPMVFGGVEIDFDGIPVTLYPLGHVDGIAWLMWKEVA